MNTKILAFPVLLISISALADVSPLCNDLAKYSCAPGHHKDVTGEVKSASEMEKFMSGYVDKTRKQLQSKFKTILENPDNSYFKDLASAGLGLKNSPQCVSKDPEDMKDCENNLIDGLTTMAQKQTLSPLMPSGGLDQIGNLSDVNYILQNDTYQNVISDLNKQTSKDLSNPATTKKIKDNIFPQIKALIIAKLDKSSIPDDQKKYMISKIKSIQFAGTNCSDTSGSGNYGSAGGSQVVSSLLIPNASYFPAQNNFKFCSGFLLQSTSEFQMAMVIGHELTHSIDPCRIAIGPSDLGFKYKNTDSLQKMEQEYPFKNVISCLRDPKSVEAKNFPANSQVATYTYGGTMAGTYPNTTSYSATTDSTPAKPTFCDNDQITESFADWMGIEVMSQYITNNYKLTPEQAQEGYANAERVLCWESPDSPGQNMDPHPQASQRINKILLVNPTIRSQMGCPAKHPENIYCDSEVPFSSNLNQRNTSSGDSDDTCPQCKYQGGAR